MTSTRRCAVVLVALTALLVPPARAAGQPGPAPGKIDAALQVQPRQETVIEFAEHADLTAARRTGDWTERGQAVVDALQDTARRSQAAVVARLRQEGVPFRSFWIDNTVHLGRSTASLTAAAAADPAVARVRPARSITLEKPVESKALQAAIEWGIADIKADQVWSRLGVRGDGVVVANIDSGVQFDHPALAASYRGNAGAGVVTHDYNWFDPAHVCQQGKPCDNNGHGTHTMGTMVGDGGEGNRVGVAPGAKWIAAKGCESDSCSEESLTAAAQWILQPTDLAGQNPDVSKRPNIVNNSWGGSGGDDWYRGFVQAWVAAGIFPAFSNGNAGPGCDTAGSPGDYPESYAAGNYASNGLISPTSSRGGTKTKPDISAPGTDVRSSVPGNRYQAFSGTSMASPHVAGTVALMWSRSPALVGDVDATRQLLDDTARDQADGQCGGTTDDNNVYGEGKLDALAALDAVPAGTTGIVSGTVTAGGHPLAGATLTFTGVTSRVATSRTDGSYSISLVPGTYHLTVSLYGYRTVDAGELVVTAGETVSEDAALTKAPLVRMGGRVLDGSGHAWPVDAGITVEGTPVIARTDRRTGRYEVQLPEGAAYTVEVTPNYPGYESQRRRVDLTGATTQDYRLDIDPAACTAPGYRRPATGIHEDFTDPAGWTVVDHGTTGQVWTYQEQGNLTGGTGRFAVLDSDDYGQDGTQDSSLVSPGTDLTAVEQPVLEFRTEFRNNWLDRADVDLSLDGGTTWTNVWRQATDLRGPRLVRVPLPAAAHQQDVRVRFHYLRGGYAWWWQVDDVYLGPATCHKAPGGLLTGRTTSAVNGEPLAGVRVGQATSADDGSYWLFSPEQHGSTRFTPELEGYTAETDRVRVPADGVTGHDFVLHSGRLTAARTVDATVQLGGKAKIELALTNTGDERATYELSEREPSSPEQAAPARQNAPVQRIPATTTPLRMETGKGTRTESRPPVAAWEDLASYPTMVKDVAAASYDGKLYVFGGTPGEGDPLAGGYRYDDGTWTLLAPMPVGRQKPSAAFAGGRLVVTGGWGPGGFAPVAATSIYDPATDTWTAGAPNPRPWAASGTAVLDGMLYVVGGCDEDCGRTDVLRYDPAKDTWTRLADFPQNTAWESCGGIRGKVYCAGGIGEGTDSSATYEYTPATNSWRQVADMPLDQWASAYAVVGDELVVSGGSAERSSIITNEGHAYDPVTDRWRALPNSRYALYRTSGACGFSKVGGSIGYFFGDTAVERLPGYGDCAAPADQPWLSLSKTTGSVSPGRREVVKLTLDASRVTEPGVYTASLRVAERTPYPVAPIRVRLTVRN